MLGVVVSPAARRPHEVLLRRASLVYRGHGRLWGSAFAR